MGSQRRYPEGSLAETVLESRRTPHQEVRRARERLDQPRTPPADSPTALILGELPGSRVKLLAALLCAAMLHVGLLALAIGSVGAEQAPKIRTESPDPMDARHVVDLQPRTPPAPPEPEAPEESKAPSVQPEKPQAPTPSEPAEPSASKGGESTTESEPSGPSPNQPSAESDTQRPSSAGEAGEVVDTRAESEQVADFTDFEMPRGKAESYSGGVTATSDSGDGSGRVPPDGQGANSGAADGASGGGQGARSVGLDRSEWECAWPTKARDLSSQTQTVVLRALVGADGTPKSVSIVSDPGFGFGEAARSCALDHTFQPARDEEGRPYTATSPPIRVRFTR